MKCMRVAKPSRLPRAPAATGSTRMNRKPVCRTFLLPHARFLSVRALREPFALLCTSPSGAGMRVGT
jgi:hypothetical protein